MSNNKYLSLDFRAIELFLLTIETQSFTRTAERLNITQSAVSHALTRLRDVFQDPLFIRSGRGISPTPRALLLAHDLRQINTQIKNLAQPAIFYPESAHIHWRIAANDLQRDATLPEFYRQIAQQVSAFTLSIYPSEVPNVDDLRDNKVDLIISPIAPDAPDIVQRLCFSDHPVCFYDTTARSAPQTLEDFAQANYIGLSFLEGKSLLSQSHRPFDIEQKTRIRVSNFSGLRHFLKGTPFLVIMPQKLAHLTMDGFTHCPLPWITSPQSMYMLWHQKNRGDPTHTWLREQLFVTIKLMAL